MRRAPATRPAARPERRVQQRTLATREKLVAAALEVFSARGFEGATTRAIAERAGVALAALPYHFETKEALWRAAADFVFARLREAFAARPAPLAQPAPGERLPALLGDFVRFAARHPELHRFMLQEGTDEGPRLRWLVETHVRPLYRRLRAAILHEQQQGRLPAGRPEHLFYAMIGAASMPYAVAPEFERLTGAAPAASRLVDAHVETMLAIFVRGGPSG